MGNPIAHVTYKPDKRHYEIVIGGVFMVVTEEDIEKFPNSVLVCYVLSKVAEQQKCRQKEGGT